MGRRLVAGLMADTPHFALPFRIERGRVAVNEQDSLDDIAACAEVIVRYPTLFVIELPEFGAPDVAFGENGTDLEPLVEAVERWGPRTAALAERDPEAFADFVDRIAVNVGTPQGAA